MSAVYIDRSSNPKGRFSKGDTVEMSLIEGGARTKRVFKISQGRYHPSNAFYEYQLSTANGKLYKGGAWIRERQLRAVERHKPVVRESQEHGNSFSALMALEGDTSDIMGPQKDAVSRQHSSHGYQGSDPGHLAPDAEKARIDIDGVAHLSDIGSMSLTRQAQRPGETMDSNNVRERHDDETPTDQINSSDLSYPTQEALIRTLAEDLASKMVARANPFDVSSIARVHNGLPGALQAFARLIGHLDQSQETRDVMVIASQHKEVIATQFKNRLEERTLQSRIQQQPEGPDLKQRGEAIQSWLPMVHDDSARDTNTANPFKDVPNIPRDEFRDTQTLTHYQDIIFNSPAYEWLLGKLYNELLLMPTEPNIMYGVLQRIVPEISLETEFRHITRERSPYVYVTDFQVGWNPFIFLTEQAYNQPPEQAIAQAITLTGSLSEAQSLSTLQYLKQTWGQVGEETLRLFQDFVRPGRKAMRPPRYGLLTNGTALTLNLLDGILALRATGTLDAIAEMGQLIGWLGAALRNSPQEKGPVYCYPVVDMVKINHQTSSRTHASCKISFQFEAMEEDEPIDSKPNGRCWRNLFRNPVVVKGYPIPKRPTRDVGLEIPLDMMAALIGTNRITKFAERAFLKRFSAMLLLNSKIGDILMWHLLFNEDGGHLSYADPRVHLNPGPGSETVSMATLSTSRHIVGWCSQVQNVTGGPVANYNIAWSGLPKPQSRCAFEKVSISGGKIISASVSAAIGKKDKAICIRSRSDYFSQLKWLEKKYVILYDLEDERGWLIDGVSTLLHLVRASLESDSQDSFKEHFQYRPEQLEEAGTDTGKDGKAAAISVLTNVHNQNLALYKKPDENYEETTIKNDGETDEVSKKKKTYVCFKDRVEMIYHLLEQIVTHQSNVDSEDGVGFRIKSTPRRQLEGFDFMDIASDEDPFWPRVTTLRATGAGWVDFVRAIHAITLFGHGFGELMKPSEATQTCVHWEKLPTGLDYLAVSTSVMNDIVKRRGDKRANPWRLVDDIRWITPDKLFQTCDCSKTSTTKKSCDRVQVLLSTNSPKLYTGSYKSPGTLTTSGAIILGHSWKYPLRWANHGEPEEGEPASEDERPPRLYDSGLGSSLAPSSRSEGSAEPDALSDVSNERPVKQLPKKQKRSTLDVFHVPRLWRS